MIRILILLLIPFFSMAQVVIEDKNTVCMDTVKAEKIAKDLMKKENLELQNENLRKQIMNYEVLADQYVSLNNLFQITIYSQQQAIGNLAVTNSAGVNIMSGIKQDIEAFRLSYYNRNIELDKENKRLEESNSRKTKAIVILSTTLGAIVVGLIAL